jgi:hypothetical protein
MPEALIGPECPYGFDVTWQAFCELSSSRQWSDWGAAQALTWAEIDAWMRVTGRHLPQSELRLVRMLDSEYRLSAAKALSDANKSGDDDDDW